VYNWKVELTYGTHYVIADDYSVTGGFYIFWVGKNNVRMFPDVDVVNVSNIGKATTERVR